MLLEQLSLALAGFVSNFSANAECDNERPDPITLQELPHKK